MSITEVTTPITKRWLMNKSKDELSHIILANLDRIDIFSYARPDIAVFQEAALAAEKATDDAWIEILDGMWQEQRKGNVFENWALSASARRALQKIRGWK